MTPTEIQQAFALPAVPSYAAVGGNFPDDATVYMGTAAENSFGPGGGLQLFSAIRAQAPQEGEDVSAVLSTLEDLLNSVGLNAPKNAPQ